MNRYPMDATFELTLRCNLSCQMCLLHQENVPELTCDQWLSIAQQAKDLGTLSLLLTGGEPMLRKDFISIYEGIYQKGFLLTLYTNATMVTDPILECLKKYPPHRIGVTLYGASNQDYASVCGCADGFDRAMAGLKKLLTLPSAVEVRFTPTRHTIDAADALEQYIGEQFGIPLTLSARVLGAVRGCCTKPQDCRPTPEQTVESIWGRIENRIRQSIPAEMRDLIQVQIFDRCEQATEDTTLLGCSAGINSYTISCDGKLLGCQLLDCFQTDALKEGLASAWERFPETVHLPPTPCKGCQYFENCTICPAVAMAETGRLDGVPEYICEITKLTEMRKENFVL